MPPRPYALVLLVCALIAPRWICVAETVNLIRKDDRVRVEIGGKLFTEYRFDDGLRPYFYPLQTADGTSLTRHWPQEPNFPNEEHDHNHHHSLWFGHGNVNGVDFWSDSSKSGTITQTQLVESNSGDVGVLEVKDNWVGPDAKIICSDRRIIRFGETAGARFLDFQITIYASNGPVIFGDTKEGTMAIRINEALRLTHREGKTTIPGTGHIVNSAGGRDDDTWGQHAEWCDYFGPLNGKVVGIALFDSPTNPRHAPRWQVRDYGLFAANPFGEHDYDKTFAPKAGDFTLPADGHLTLNYRFYFHEGDTAKAGVQDHFDEWARAMKTAKPTP